MLRARLALALVALWAFSSAAAEDGPRGAAGACDCGGDGLCIIVPPTDSVAGNHAPCYQGTPVDTLKTLETDPFLVDGAVAKCGTCPESGFPRYLRNDPIYTSMGLWVRDNDRAGKRPPTPAAYPTLTCGAVWEKNTTWTEESVIDYFAVVDSDHFKLVATDVTATPSTDACESAAYVMAAPICNDDPSCADATYGPTEHYFKSGDSFNMTVSKASPPTPGGFDLMFKGSEGGAVPCNYVITIRALSIEC